ncbi:MAG: putative RNA methyltransferase [Actinomycetota bacterium]
MDDVLRFLVCPYCRAPLAREGASLRCPDGHVFDIARQGYVNLQAAGDSGATGDTGAMVAARADFLAGGHFDQVATGLALAASDAESAVADGAVAGGPGGQACVIDAGAGTGFYLAAVLDGLPDRAGLALDASKFALRRAARAHPRIGAVACDVWRGLPVADGAAGVLLNVFAPRNGPEFHRVLAPGGRLLVATPTAEHLQELIVALGLLTVDGQKQERLSRTLGDRFDQASEQHIAGLAPMSHADVLAAVQMGPSAWQADPAQLRSRIATLPDPLPVTVSVTLSGYARRH